MCPTALGGAVHGCEAARCMEVGIPSLTYRAVFQPVLADCRKHRGNAPGIRRAHTRAPLSSESLRVGPYEDRARAGHSTSARDCAHVRTCNRSP